MNRRALVSVLAMGAMLGMAACEDEDEGPDVETFRAVLTGGAERPTPVNTTATGTAEFEVNANNTVDFIIRATNLNGLRLGHIHGPATTELAASVVVTLLTPIAAPGVNIANNGIVSEGTFPSAQYALSAGISMDSVLTWMRTGRAYVNLHTVANGGGEIRGQVSRN